MKNNILIFVEQRQGKINPVSYELISETRKLLNDTPFLVKAIYLTDLASEKDLANLALAGAQEIILLEDKNLKDYNTHNYSQAISNFFDEYSKPEVFLIGSTLLGRDLAPRISARIKTGLTADATKLDFEIKDDRPILLATRPALGGNIFATILCQDHIPQMASIRPGVFSIEKYLDQKVNLKKVKANFANDTKVKVINHQKLAVKEANLEKAKLVFAGGRGVSQKFATLLELANLTGGEVAASRAVVDANIATKNQQVGQTGVTIKPVVYVASGISGAIQHIAGMEKSELIIAINNDPNALIFDISDVSIISDANQVLPLLIDEIKTLKHFNN